MQKTDQIDKYEAPQIDYDWMNPLLTDMYQVTMSYAEWKSQRAEVHSVFEAFFRKNPFKGSYTIFGGLDEVLGFLSKYKFTEDHVKYLHRQMPNLDQGYLDWLLNLDCSKIKVSGLKDGTICHPNVPLLRLEGPFALLQLLETPILNLINFSSLVATNATRMVMLSGPNVGCVEFGLRRAQGPNGACTASKYAYLGGFVGTSNVYAGYLTGMSCLGTQAHSFIMSFEDESDVEHARKLDGVDLLEKALEYRNEKLKWTNTILSELYAFVSYATAYPDSFAGLVDSYNTKISGIPNFLIVALCLADLGYKAQSIRLDSGDLAELSIFAKQMFKETGDKFGQDFSGIKVVASSDINEGAIQRMNDMNHQIDVFGIGTNLVTCQAQPALGMVYKVVEFKGTPRMKLSEEVGKITTPGSKSVVRAYNKQDQPMFDILCLTSEYEGLCKTVPQGNTVNVTRKSEGKQIEVPDVAYFKGLTHTLFEGKPVYEVGELKDRRDYCLKQLVEFGGIEKLMNGSQPEYEVLLSNECYALYNKMYQELQR